DLALVHAASLLRKTFADVLGIADDLAYVLEHLGLKLGQVLGRFRWCCRSLCLLRRAVASGLGLAPSHVKARCRQHLADLMAVADRTCQDSPGLLRIVVVGRPEPALEDVACIALEIKHFQ